MPTEETDLERAGKGLAQFGAGLSGCGCLLMASPFIAFAAWAVYVMVRSFFG